MIQGQNETTIIITFPNAGNALLKIHFVYFLIVFEHCCENNGVNYSSKHYCISSFCLRGRGFEGKGDMEGGLYFCKPCVLSRA